MLRKDQKLILSWYDENGRYFPWRKSSATKYERIISEVLLQRTRAEKVAVFFPGFIRRYPSWRRLSKAKRQTLENVLKPIGLYKRRAKSIHALSREMARRHGRFPKTREEIASLPNVGQYIANAIELFVFGQPRPLLDASMARILERVFGERQKVDIRYDPYLQELSQRIVDCVNPAFMNWALLDMAAIICVKSDPRCQKCPLNEQCKYHLKVKKS